MKPYRSPIAIKLLLSLLFCAPGLAQDDAAAKGARNSRVDVEKNEIVDFANDLILVFTKSGCNAGGCHGAAIGRGGFKLSLFGGDPRADHKSIVRRLAA